MGDPVDFEALAGAHDYRAIAQALLEVEEARGVYDLDRLRADPAAEIHEAGEVAVRVDPLYSAGCLVDGYYDHRTKPPTIVLHPSATAARDRFTVLHELGHHLQRTNLDWADVWLMLPASVVDRVDEGVADALAAQVLVPERLVDFGADDVTARSLRDAQRKVPTASRSALAYHALRAAGSTHDVVVVVCNLDGVVVFARAAGTMWAPRRDAAQPGLTSLVEMASSNEGRASGELRPGLVAGSGAVQDALRADVCIDESGRYAFAVIRPISRRARPSWSTQTHQCANPACDEEFSTNEARSRCGSCEELRCPACGTCGCTDDSLMCARCHMALSAAERTDPSSHECW